MSNQPKQICFNQLFLKGQYSKQAFNKLIKAKQSSSVSLSLQQKQKCQKFQLGSNLLSPNKQSSFYEVPNFQQKCVVKITDLAESKNKFLKQTNKSSLYEIPSYSGQNTPKVIELLESQKKLKKLKKMNHTLSNHQDFKNLSQLSNDNFRININHNKTLSLIKIQSTKGNELLKQFNQEYKQYKQDKEDIGKGVLTTHNFRKFLLPKKGIPVINKETGRILIKTDKEISLQDTNSKLKMVNFLFNVKQDVNEKKQTVINLMKKMTIAAEESDKKDKLKRDLIFVKNIFTMFLKKKKLNDDVELNTQREKEA